MTQADLSDIATLQIGGSRGPSGWIEWTQRNYEEHGFGLEESSKIPDPREIQLDGVRREVGRLKVNTPRLGQAGEVG